MSKAQQPAETCLHGAAYARDTWSLTAHGRSIPKALLDPSKIGPEQAGYDVNLPNSQSINHVSSRFYLDLRAR